MTRTNLIALSAAAVVAVAGVMSMSTGADAKGAKEYFQETYQFDRPMNGFEGFSGNYHCSYYKVPKTVCKKNGKCKKIWELRQTCQ